MTETSQTTRPRAWVWTLARLAIQTFYRVERVGEALPSGALLLLANHPNALLDPAVVQTTAGRQVRFLAKSTLFQRHPLSVFIRNSGAIPVYRRIDPGVDATRNVEMFSAVESALAEGEAICLFPEGISHDHGKLETLRTGASRMALSSTSRGHPVKIVPVGLNFDHSSAFRSRVTAVFGQTFEYDDIVADYRKDEALAVRDLTERISHRLRQLMVEANPRDDLSLVARIDRLYASARGVSRKPKDQIIRRQLIADGMEVLREHDPDHLHAILAQVRSYDESLDRFRLRDRDVEQRITPGLAWRFIIREGLLGLVLAPLAVLSLVIFALPYWLTGRFGRRAPDLQSRATWKVAGGVMAYGLWIGLLATAVWVGRGWQVGLGAAGALTALAFIGLFAFEREAAVFRTVKAYLALRQTPLKARAALKRQRVELASVLERVGEWVRD